MPGDEEIPIIVTPEIEMQLGYERFATGPLLDAGRGPGIGVDIVSNVSGEMFTQMRMALRTQRAYDNVDRLERGEEIDSLTVSAREALEWATINGARDVGLDDRVGSLTPGKRADVMLISTDDINTIPGHSPVDTVVFQSTPSNVDTVLVGGNVVKRDGELTDPAYPELKREFVDASRRLLRESGGDTVTWLAPPRRVGGPRFVTRGATLTTLARTRRASLAPPIDTDPDGAYRSPGDLHLSRSWLLLLVEP